MTTSHSRAEEHKRPRAATDVWDKEAQRVIDDLRAVIRLFKLDWRPILRAVTRYQGRLILDDEEWVESLGLGSQLKREVLNRLWSRQDEWGDTLVDLFGFEGSFVDFQNFDPQMKREGYSSAYPATDVASDR